MMAKIKWTLVWLFVPCTLWGHTALQTTIDKLMVHQAVSGREDKLIKTLATMLADLEPTTDAMGNLQVKLTGEKAGDSRLIAVGIDQPGYIVGAIEPDGYLRLKSIGSRAAPKMWHAYHRGQKVLIGTRSRFRYGVVATPSIHLATNFSPTPVPSETDLYVDVGVDTADAVAKLGIQVTDTVTGLPQVTKLSGGHIAGLAVRQKAGAALLVHLAHQLAKNKDWSGNVTFVWLRFEHLARQGRNYQLARTDAVDKRWLLTVDPLPAAPANSYAEKPHYFAWGPLASTLPSAQVLDEPAPPGRKQLPGEDGVTYLSLPVQHAVTPVETLNGANLQRLQQDLLGLFGKTPGPVTIPDPALPQRPAFQTHRLKSLYEDLAQMIAIPAVSGGEAQIQNEIITRLQKTVTGIQQDELGNVWVTLGQGDYHVAFIAHLDEVGFQATVDETGSRFQLANRGGLYDYIWEGQPAVIYAGEATEKAIIEPRATDSDRAFLDQPAALWAYTGTQPLDAAFTGDNTYLTMRKGLVPLGNYRAAGRGCDDRCGTVVLLQALEQLAQYTLPHRISFIWSVQEETGLVGAKAIFENLKDVDRVHPIDTFVTAARVVDEGNFGQARLGGGPVLRAMDSVNASSLAELDRATAIGRQYNIPLQIGYTGGATDGTIPLAKGIATLPIGWPGRYSHSPVEVVDLRDLLELKDFVIHLALAPTNN